MQLHPTEDPDMATEYAVQSLARGLIGFGFSEDPADLTLVAASSLPDGVRKHDVEFATRMEVGDKVLVMVHQFPFALVTVASDYYYLRRPVRTHKPVLPELGIWFNHFRRVAEVKYYADRVKDARKWEKYTRAPTIQRLTDPNSAAYRLIESWG
jgi:hypothetical protein